MGVILTRASLFADALRAAEAAKIECSQAHIEALATGAAHETPARYVVARILEDVLVGGDSAMNKTKLRYFDNEDILHLVISDEPEANSIEIQPNWCRTNLPCFQSGLELKYSLNWGKYFKRFAYRHAITAIRSQHRKFGPY